MHANTIGETTVYNGFLYNVSDMNYDTVGYLMGTIHLVTKQNITFNDSFKRVFEQMNRLALQVDILVHANELREKIEAANPMGLRNVKKLSEHANLKPGIVLRMLDVAKSFNVKIIELESVDEQVDALKPYAFESEITENELDEAVKRLLAEEKSYIKGDEKEFLNSFLKKTEAEKTLLHTRNVNMAERIDSLLRATGGKTLIAVGISHLVGEGVGLVSLLNQKGWHISRVV